MKLTIPKLMISEKEGFTPEKDIFKRKEFGERLANLIENSQDNLVIALDAKWGEGKSTFIQMWRGYIGSQRVKKIKSIYFDAFAYDYQKDPFLALAGELYELIKDNDVEPKKDFIEKASNAGKSLLRGAIKIGVNVVSGGLLNEKVVDNIEKDVSSIAEQVVDDVISDKLRNIKRDRLAINEFKECLKDFSLKQGDGAPIVFIIDELDRCRPDFALELLEQVKHLFSVPGIAFLLVINREQLEESLKSRYGSGVDATQYLQKFIQIWLTLPRKADQNEDAGAEYLAFALKEMLEKNEKFKNTDSLEMLSELVILFKPSYREIEQVLSYFSILNNMTKNGPYFHYFQGIIAFVCYLKVSKPRIFKRILSEEITIKELLTETGLSNVKHKSALFRLLEYIRFDFADKSERSKMMEEKRVTFDFRAGEPKNMMKVVCKWITEINFSDK